MALTWVKKVLHNACVNRACDKEEDGEVCWKPGRWSELIENNVGGECC